MIVNILKKGRRFEVAYRCLRWACLGIVCAWTTGLELAVFTLEDEPVWSAMAHVAIPLDECALGLDKLERVCTESGDGHD